MAEKSEIKVTRTYSLDPDLVTWVTRKSSLLTLEADGERISDSKVVNDILRAAMERDAEENEVSPTIKKKTNPKLRAARMEAVAA